MTNQSNETHDRLWFPIAGENSRHVVALFRGASETLCSADATYPDSTNTPPTAADHVCRKCAEAGLHFEVRWMEGARRYSVPELNIDATAPNLTQDVVVRAIKSELKLPWDIVHIDWNPPAEQPPQ